MRIADALCQALRAVGIERVYGLPGEDHIELLDAIGAAGLEYFCVANESAAAIMAGADAQLSGLPGVVVLSMAPGVSNAVNGLLNCYMDGLPVIVLTGAFSAELEPFTIRQNFGVSALTDPVTKWRAAVSSQISLSKLVAKAVDIATADRPGPVLIELAEEVAALEAASDDAVAPPAHPGAVVRTRAPLAPDHPVAADLFERLQRAARPVLIVGGRSVVDPTAVADFAERWRCPVLATTRHIGLLAADHDWNAGTYLNGNLESSLLKRADLVLASNLEAFDIYNRRWQYDAAFVSISARPLTEWLFSFDERHLAEPSSLLRCLADERALTGASVWTTGELETYRATVADALRADGHGASPFGVAQAVRTVLNELPSDAITVADAGFSKPIIAMLSRPGAANSFLASNALSTMGYAIPAALAASRQSRRPVVGFMGDGSLLMRASEIAYSGGIVAPIVLVAIMDRSLSQIEIKQRRRKLEPLGVSLPKASCAAIAGAFGIRGVDVHDPGELATATREAFARPGATVIGAYVSTSDSPRVFAAMRG